MKQSYKIGIGIVHCLSKGNSSGWEVVHTTDKNQWIDSIDDTGRVFNYVAETSEPIIRLIRLESEGWYICSMFPTIDREHEYRASWIYFPAAINLTAADIKTILSNVECQISSSNYDTVLLDKLAERYSYEGTNSYPRFIIPEGQKGFAIRYVGGSNPSLYDIFDNICQKEYCKYKWIVLLPKEGTELVSGSNIADITGCRFSMSTIINPACDHNGFIPYINNCEFSTPIRLFDGETINVIWKKPGYKDISVVVSKQEDINVPSNKIWRQFACKFTVVDGLTKRPISSHQIKMITECEKDNFGNIYIAEKDLHEVTFIVSAYGYESDTFRMDFSKIPVGGSIPTVELEPEEHRYIFLLPLDSDVVKERKKVKIEIKSQYKIIDSPIKGYTCVGKISENGNNELKLKPQVIDPSSETGKHGKNGDTFYTNTSGGKRPKLPKRLNKVLKYLFFTLLVGCIAGLAWSFFMDEGNPMNTPSCGPDKAVETSQVSKNDSWEEALKTLKDSKTAWHEKALSKHKDLQSVYDMINKYEFNKIVSFYKKHESDLSKIDVWKKLYQYASHKEQRMGKYSQDGSITIADYLSKISNFPDKTNLGASTTTTITTTTSTGSGICNSSGSNGKDKTETNSEWE